MPQLQSVFGWNDILSLLIAAACLAGAVIVLARMARSLRPALFALAPAADPPGISTR